MILTPSNRRVRPADEPATPRPELHFFRMFDDGDNISVIPQGPEFTLNRSQAWFDQFVADPSQLALVKQHHKVFCLLLLNDGQGNYSWQASTYRSLLDTWRSWPRRPASDLEPSPITPNTYPYYGYREWLMADGIQVQSRTKPLLLVFAKGAFSPKFADITKFL